jgi:endoglucanase
MPRRAITAQAGVSHDSGYRSWQRDGCSQGQRLPARPRLRGRRMTVLLRLSLVLIMVVIAVAAWQAVQAPVPLTLRVSGNKLVNASRSPVRLLGVDRSGTEYACNNGRLTDGSTGEQSITTMTSWHIDAVRIPLNEDCWLGINRSRSSYSSARYRTMIRQYVDRLNQAGLYVILDLHWNAPGSERATGQQRMADLDHAPAFWSSVARVFKTDPAVAFDLYNEPNGISWQCWRDGCVLPEGWRAAGMQMLVDAVRATGARQPIIATGLNWGNDLGSWLRYRPHDPANQLVAGLHVYNFNSCVTVACWNSEVKPVARKVPVVAAELGEADCSHEFISRFMNWADSAGVSYLAWSWNPSGCRSPALIRSWGGQATAYGEGLRAHLMRLHRQ